MPFNKREKILSGAIIVLISLLLFLSFKIIDQNITIFGFGNEKYSDPGTMEETIERASMVFLCKSEVQGDMIKSRISEILYKQREYEFPYSLNDYYPRLDTKSQGEYYGEGQIVILSAKLPITFQSLMVRDGVIPGFKNISLDEFKKKVEEMKR